jgi:hypothetical protein
MGRCVNEEGGQWGGVSMRKEDSWEVKTIGEEGNGAL